MVMSISRGLALLKTLPIRKGVLSDFKTVFTCTPALTFKVRHLFWIEGGGGGAWGGSEHRNTAKKVKNTASPQEKSTKHTVTASPQHVFWAPWFVHLHLKTYSYTSTIFHNSFHCPRVDTADACIKSFSFLVLEKKPCAKEADERKEKRPSQIPIFFYLVHFSWCNPLTGADWSPILTESIAFRS